MMQILIEKKAEKVEGSNILWLECYSSQKLDELSNYDPSRVTYRLRRVRYNSKLTQLTGLN